MVEICETSSAPCFKIAKVKSLPATAESNTIYYVKGTNDTVVKCYITDTHGNPTLIAGTEVLPQNFTDLLDAPNSYVGQALKNVRVNSTETGLEFYNAKPDGTLLGWDDFIDNGEEGRTRYENTLWEGWIPIMELDNIGLNYGLSEQTVPVADDFEIISSGGFDIIGNNFQAIYAGQVMKVADFKPI